MYVFYNTLHIWSDYNETVHSTIPTLTMSLHVMITSETAPVTAAPTTTLPPVTGNLSDLVPISDTILLYFTCYNYKR
jgi:hypothetical protein